MNDHKDSDQLIESEHRMDADDESMELLNAGELSSYDEDEDDIIELTDVVSDNPVDESHEIEPADSLIDAMGIPLEPESDLPDMDVGILSGSDTDRDLQDPLTGAQSISVSPEQLEAALTRVIQRLVSDKLDSILVNAVEKAVSKEIDKIKRLLLEDAPGNNFY
ncbi:MAG: hypothetical protein PHP23_05650 [Desulfobacterales bacterium]|nr:hypothetical protein [Desulfobacterales bacterium]MDD4072636.1 hypothetical protein [Desulfobacterales bacterium]MDD4391468.1 hypothetical protein [Desulfobacterales bacterium]